MISIPVTIAPATKEMLLDEKLMPKENVLYFLYRPHKYMAFTGPHYLHESMELDTLVPLWREEAIHVITSEEGCYTFLLNLEEASPEDMRNGTELRYGFTFYVLDGEEAMLGPYVLTDQTDQELLSRDLEQKKIFIPAKEQNFRHYKSQHSA